MKLYSFAPQDCAGKVRWLAYELGLELEDIKLSYKNGDTKTPEFLAKSPIGQVPAFEDGRLVLHESYAIVAYLADKYPEKKLAPPVTDLEARAIYNQWLFFATDTAEDFFARHARLPKMSEEYRKEWGDYIVDKTQKVLSYLEHELTGREYVLGGFSAVDACLGYAIDGVAEEPFFNDYPNVKAYYERLAGREACLRSEIFKRETK